MKPMSRVAKTRRVAEFGDFQTPEDLARQACELLAQWTPQPKSLVEPTCGIGNFLFAALDQFPSSAKAVGLDISTAYVQEAKLKLSRRTERNKVTVVDGDFFHTDWPELLANLPDPLLVVGNPPWVTNAHLGLLNSSNLPEKVNFQKYSGLDAITGKSNFDISEWILIRLLHCLNNRDAVMGMLCKTSVARKLLAYGWKNNINLADSAIYQVDAAAHFGTSVDACFLVCKFTPGLQNPTSRIYDSINEGKLKKIIGMRDGGLVASVELFERWKHLAGESNRWRSGIKHDCARVMELKKEGDRYRNGLGEVVELEDDFIYPMMKSSEVARDSATFIPRLWMLVPQRSMRDDTASIEEVAPKTWRYLLAHAELLDKRGSSIYKKRPRFSIFGVGDYSFSAWKVAISGFYKKLHFKVIGSHGDKPFVLDDTSNFIACETREEADFIASLLNSDIAKEFFGAYIFWDAKRPITIDILRRLDIAALAQEVSPVTDDAHDLLLI